MVVITGKDKGKTGSVSRALPRESSVVISGVNVKKVHKRRRSKKERSQIFERAYPIDVSNVALVDPKSKKPTRIGKKENNGVRVRFAKKSGEILA